MSAEPIIPAEIAAHVLWHEGEGGHPAGSFTTALLIAWAHADHANEARLAAEWPEYAAAYALFAQPGGIARLREIAEAAQ
ncbi:hypothetical protein [Streptomyces sp. NPDC088674]|uniref:hypothetical protein n=1 Tax=Streptomyces sp. NPDC088674 TaxID=3365869 RepID=UPI00381D36A0